MNDVPQTLMAKSPIQISFFPSPEINDKEEFCQITDKTNICTRTIFLLNPTFRTTVIIGKTRVGPTHTSFQISPLSPALKLTYFVKNVFKNFHLCVCKQIFFASFIYFKFNLFFKNNLIYLFIKKTKIPPIYFLLTK